LALWGPVLDGMDSIKSQYSLMEMCALQWKACVDKAEHDLSMLSSDRVLKVEYEEFVQNPVEEFSKIASFLDKDVSDEINVRLKANISPKSLGKGRGEFSDKEIDKLNTLIGDSLQRYNYD